MADEEKTTVEVAEGEGSAPPKKGGNKLVLFGGIGLAVVVLGVVLALFVIKPMMSGDSVSDDTEQIEGEAEETDDNGHGGDDEKSGNALAYAIKEIVVNPAGTGGSRYLSVSFGFDLKSGKLSKKFEANESMVRDALITILSSKTVTQLTDTRQKEIMRYQIKKRLSKLLKTDGIKAVYYTDFVMQ